MFCPPARAKYPFLRLQLMEYYLYKAEVGMLALFVPQLPLKVKLVAK